MSDRRGRTWAAFLAGAVAMLAVGLAWLAWSRTQDAVSSAIRAEVLLPRSVDLPLPPTPPPEGPRLPRPPTPSPR